MARTENGIYLLTTFDAEGQESERLVNAPTRGKAVQHALRCNLASAQDVARVLGAGGKIEDAKE